MINKSNQTWALILLIFIITTGMFAVIETIFRLRFIPYQIQVLENANIIQDGAMGMKNSPYPGIKWELLPNMNAFLRSKRFVTNASGFRGHDFPLQKSQRTVRIIGIGDSVMMGWGVAQGEDYLSLLAQELNQTIPEKQFEALNFAVAGYDTIQEYFTLREKAMSYDPDIIILGYTGNDALEPNSSASGLRFPTISFFYNFLLLKKMSNADPRRSPFYLDYRYFEPASKDAPKNVYEAITEIARLAKAHSIPVLMVMDSRYEWPSLTHEKVSAFARSMEFRVINLYKLYRNLPARTSIEDAVSIRDHHNLKYLLEIGINKDNHPNSSWHQRTALTITKEVETLLSRQQKVRP